MKEVQVTLRDPFANDEKQFKLIMTGTQLNVQALDPSTLERKAIASAARGADGCAAMLLWELGYALTIGNEAAMIGAITLLIKGDEA